MFVVLRLAPPEAGSWWEGPRQHFPFSSPVVTRDGVFVLDLAAKIDATADYVCKAQWGDVDFPPPFGREAYPEVREETERLLV